MRQTQTTRLASPFHSDAGRIHTRCCKDGFRAELVCMCAQTCCYACGFLLAVAHVPGAKFLACAHAIATALGGWVLACAHGGTHDQTHSVDACSRFLVLAAVVKSV